MFSKKITPELCREMRTRAGLKQHELGDLMGWSKRTVIKRENEEFKLSLAEFEKFMLVTTSSPEERQKRRKLMGNIEKVIDQLIEPYEKKTQ